MFGVDDALIIGAIASLASAGISYNSQQQAAKRQQREATAARQRQLMAQNQATDQAAKKAAEFDPTARKQQQDAIEQDMTGQLQQSAAAPQITAQGVQVGATIPGGTQDYLAAKARETAKTTESMRALASLMGRIGSASELRRKEAVGIGDTAGDIGRIQTGAGNIGGIDMVGIDAAGQPDFGSQLASEALRYYGASRAAGGTKPKYGDNNTASGPTGGWISA